MNEDLFDRYVEDNELRQHTREELREELIYKMRGLTKKAFFSDKEIMMNKEGDWQGQLVVRWDDIVKILEGK